MELFKVGLVRRRARFYELYPSYTRATPPPPPDVAFLYATKKGPGLFKSVGVFWRSMLTIVDDEVPRGIVVGDVSKFSLEAEHLLVSLKEPGAKYITRNKNRRRKKKRNEKQEKTDNGRREYSEVQVIQAFRAVYCCSTPFI